MSEASVTLHEELGQGQTGKVFRATGEGGQALAVKRFHTQLCRPGLAMDEVLRVRQAIAALRHPGVLPPGATWTEADGALCLNMPLAPGGSLAERLERQGPMPIREAIELLSKVGAALQSAHLAGVIHGDVKPSNVLLGQDGGPLLSDFGHAGLVLQDELGRELADEDYLAPELLAGGRPDHRSDVYGLAATLYAMLTGLSPRQGAAWRVAPQLRPALERGLARDPAARPPDVDTFLRELTQAARPRAAPVVGMLLGGLAVAGLIAAVVALVLDTERDAPVAEPPPPAADAGPTAPVAPVAPAVPEVGGALPPGVEAGRGRPGDAPGEQAAVLAAPAVRGPRRCEPALEEIAVERTVTRNGYAYAFVRNTCDFPVDKPRVELGFFDATGRPLTRAFGFAAYELLGPGERSPVRVLLKPFPEGWTRYETDITAREPAAAYRRPARLEVLETRATAQGLGHSLDARVKVRNADSEPVEHVEVTVGLYDDAGKLRCMYSGYAKPSPLPPGAEGEARVFLLPAEKIEPVRLEAWADGVIYTRR